MNTARVFWIGNSCCSIHAYPYLYNVHALQASAIKTIHPTRYAARKDYFESGNLLPVYWNGVTGVM
jgi:hypothetical protein